MPTLGPYRVLNRPPMYNIRDIEQNTSTNKRTSIIVKKNLRNNKILCGVLAPFILLISGFGEVGIGFQD